MTVARPTRVLALSSPSCQTAVAFSAERMIRGGHLVADSKHRATVVFVACAIGMTVVTGPTAAAAGDDRPALVEETSPIEELTHVFKFPVSAAAAFGWADAHGFELTRLRHSQDFTGEYFPQERSPRAALVEYLSIIATDYGTQPEVVEVSYLTTEVDPNHRRNPARLSPFDAPPASKSVVGSRTAAAAARARNLAPETAPAAYLPAWAPTYTEQLAREENPGIVVIRTFAKWNSTSGNHPRHMPSDWGLEFDFSLFNDDISGVHPFCPPGTDDNFWAGRGTARGEIRSWSVYNSGYSTGDLGGYFDGNDASDPCSRLGLPIGIGYPDNINARSPSSSSYELETTLRTDRGNQSASLFEHLYDAVSNDCNNLGLPPDSDCMGLNDNRVFPGPGADEAYTLNRDRLYYAPACHSYLSGNSSPFLFDCNIYPSGFVTHGPAVSL